MILITPDNVHSRNHTGNNWKLGAGTWAVWLTYSRVLSDDLYTIVSPRCVSSFVGGVRQRRHRVILGVVHTKVPIPAHVFSELFNACVPYAARPLRAYDQPLVSNLVQLVWVHTRTDAHLHAVHYIPRWAGVLTDTLKTDIGCARMVSVQTKVGVARHGAPFAYGLVGSGMKKPHVGLFEMDATVVPERLELGFHHGMSRFASCMARGLQ
jgi:hypothetical protein